MHLNCVCWSIILSVRVYETDIHVLVEQHCFCEQARWNESILERVIMWLFFKQAESIPTSVVDPWH